MPEFNQRSKHRLQTCDSRLIKLFAEVVKYFDCSILEGKRTPERQAELLREGKSKILYSKHLEGLAVDVAPYPIDWTDRDRFHYFAGFVMGVAKQMDIPIRWGGDWDGNTQVKDNKFDDLVHYEIGGL